MDTQTHPCQLACHANRKPGSIQTFSFFRFIRLEQSFIFTLATTFTTHNSVTPAFFADRAYTKGDKKRKKSVPGWLLINGGHLMLERYKRARWSTSTCQTLLSERNLVQRYIVEWLYILLRASDQNHSSACVTVGIDKRLLQTFLKTYDALHCPCRLAEMAIFKTDACFLDA